MSGGGDGGGSHPWPLSDPIVVWPSSLTDAPCTIKDLIGMKCRVVKFGDAVTEEYEPGRVTLLLDQEGRIANVYFEQEKPII